MAKKKSKNESRPKMTAKRREQFQQAREALIKNWPRLRRRKGVHGVSVGLREQDGEKTDEVVLQVFVDEKLDETQLGSARQLPSELDGVPVDVVVRGRYEATGDDDAAATFTTLQGGVGISPKSAPSEFGTLGFPISQMDGFGEETVRLLTNAHVVLGRFTKPSALPAGEKMIQHASAGNGTRVIGEIIKSKVFLNSLVDCALIAPDDDVDIKDGIRGIKGTNFTFGELTDDDVNDEVTVVKVGAATNKRAGTVESVTQTFTAPGSPGRPGVTFFLQIAIRPFDGGPPFSDHGDSGAVVLKGNEIVGLLHGLTPDGIAIACHIKDVRDKLKF